jgi:hypothetical protein
MPRYLIELQLPPDDSADSAQLGRVVCSALKRIDDRRPEESVKRIGLVSNGHRTYCVVQAANAASVSKLMQTAMLPCRILRITEVGARID